MALYKKGDNVILSTGEIMDLTLIDALDVPNKLTDQEALSIAEILCIGSELLLGETINTNASYISRELAGLGIDCYYQTTVGDNLERIKNALDIALKRADTVIITGGLGPTDDDITINAIADYFNEELILDEDSLNGIRNFFASLNRSMPESNIKQGLRPKDARPVPNPAGTAPGIILKKLINGSEKIIITFPGVPDELYAMWKTTAKDYLKQYSSGIILTKHLNTII